MSLKINTSISGDTAILDCEGKIVAGDAISALGEAVHSQQNPRIALDLSKVKVIDGAGLGLLVSLHKWANSSGKRLRLNNASWRVLDLLQLTRLDSILNISSGAEAEQRTAEHVVEDRPACVSLAE